MALSNITLTGGMRANLFALQSTQKLMETTQNRLSTGKKVNSALDDPINFFAAQGHTQRAGDLAFRKDEMGEGIQTIKAGDAGISAITDLIAAAKSLAQSALSAESTTEITNLENQYNALMDQIDTLAADSGLTPNSAPPALTLGQLMFTSMPLIPATSSSSLASRA